MKTCQEENIDLGLDSEAWTQPSSVIDFWRMALFPVTLATLQEYDLVLKKIQKKNIDFELDSEAWTQPFVIDFCKGAPSHLPGQHSKNMILIWCSRNA